MRFVTYSAGEGSRAGALIDDTHAVDLVRADPSLPAAVLALVTAGGDAVARARRALATAAASFAASPAEALASGLVVDLAAEGVRLEAPVAAPPIVYAVGLNYRDHAAETGQDIPRKPIIFTKARTCLTGTGAPVVIPGGNTTVDWEGELCVVLGREVRAIGRDEALDAVAGYMVGNDVSVRDWQAHSATWVVGKGFDTHGPIGPWLVTPDEAPDPSAMSLRTWVNGVIKQDSNTSQFIFDVPTVIEYLSRHLTLEAGTIIFTGTPAGVGLGRRPREFLAPGDTVRVEISGLGVLENPFVAQA